MSEALGMLECRNLPALYEAADTMLKTTKVQLVGIEKTGGGSATVMIRGELHAVRLAIEAGFQAAERVGEVLSLHVIDSPHPDLYHHLRTQNTSPL